MKCFRSTRAATLTALLFSTFYFLIACSAAADDRPNIVVILCDDLGHGDLECYGHPHIKTPNLNRLAKGGIRFTDFYSSAPVCSPSRVGLLTGRIPNRAGVYDWIPPWRSQPRPDAREQVHARSSEVFLPQLLKSAGYATCMAGKWHCNSRFNHPSQTQPGDCGFDHWMATQNNASPSHENPENFVRNGEKVGSMEGFSCQLVVDEGIRWLGEQRKRSTEQPLFMFLAFHEPHEPVASPRKLVDEYLPAAENNEDRAQYFANVANVDAAVGRFVKALDDHDIRGNTLLVFTSDNGPETLKRYARAKRSHGTPGSSAEGNGARFAKLRGMKLHTHEAGVRVAGIASWPNVIKTAREESTPVSALDFLPTACGLGNAVVPEGLELDGLDISDLLRGNTIERKKPLLWCYFNALNEAKVAMRHGKWKVLARLDSGKVPRMENITTENIKRIRNAPLTDFEIYDLKRDVGESKNLAGDIDSIPQAKLNELRDLLNTEYRSLIAGSHVWTPVKQAESQPQRAN